MLCYYTIGLYNNRRRDKMSIDLIDYRKALGIGFNDKQKGKLFANKFFIYLNLYKSKVYRDLEIASLNDYLMFCAETGIEPTPANTTDLDQFDFARYRECMSIIKSNSDDIANFLFFFIAFVNTQSQKPRYGWARKELIDIAVKALNETHIQYEIIEDDGRYFIFPQGVTEFDNALVSNVLEWLHEYPQAEKAWVKALKSYSDATDEKASEIADSFRKALETFFKEFFDSNKTLENLKPKYGDYLKNHNVPTEISNNFETLLQQYTNFMNNYAKHRDRTSDSLLEYIMYQTGNTMRLLITLKGTDG